jgi:hypothetical protein
MKTPPLKPLVTSHGPTRGEGATSGATYGGSPGCGYSPAFASSDDSLNFGFGFCIFEEPAGGESLVMRPLLFDEVSYQIYRMRDPLRLRLFKRINSLAFAKLSHGEKHMLRPIDKEKKISVERILLLYLSLQITLDRFDLSKNH